MNEEFQDLTILSIDPSIRACGWALLINGKILAGLARSKEKDPAKAILDIYYFLQVICPPNLSDLVIERPIIQDSWTQNKKQAIAKLLACYGMCLTLATANTRLWTPSASEWKGQLGKTISHIRAENALKKNKIEVEIMKKVPASLMHNTKDAIALLTKYLTKEGIIK